MKTVSVLNFVIYTYSLLEGELIVMITFEPQGVHNSGIQPSHYCHGNTYDG